MKKHLVRTFKDFWCPRPSFAPLARHLAHGSVEIKGSSENRNAIRKTHHWRKIL